MASDVVPEYKVYYRKLDIIEGRVNDMFEKIINMDNLERERMKFCPKCFTYENKNLYLLFFDIITELISKGLLTKLTLNVIDKETGKIDIMGDLLSIVMIYVRRCKRILEMINNSLIDYDLSDSYYGIYKELIVELLEIINKVPILIFKNFNKMGENCINDGYISLGNFMESKRLEDREDRYDILDSIFEMLERFDKEYDDIISKLFN